MSNNENPFDCWENHFKPTRKNCLKCSHYLICIKQEVFDLRENRRGNDTNRTYSKEYYNQIRGIELSIIQKRTFKRFLDAKKITK